MTPGLNSFDAFINLLINIHPKFCMIRAEASRAKATPLQPQMNAGRSPAAATPAINGIYGSKLTKKLIKQLRDEAARFLPLGEQYFWDLKKIAFTFTSWGECGKQGQSREGQEQILLFFCFVLFSYLKILISFASFQYRKILIISSKVLHANKCKENFPLPISHVFEGSIKGSDCSF